MTRDEKIECLLSLAHRAGMEAWGKYRMVWRGSTDIEDFRSQAALYLIQAVDRRSWGVDAPGLFYNLILNRLADWVRNHKPGKRYYKGDRIEFCGLKVLHSYGESCDLDTGLELQQIVDRKASPQTRTIVRLMLTGLNQYEVSERIHLSQSLVSRKLKELAA